MSTEVNFPSSVLQSHKSIQESCKSKNCIEEPIKFNNVKKNMKHDYESDAVTNTNYLKKKKKGIFGGIFGGKKSKNKTKKNMGTFSKSHTSVTKKSDNLSM